MLSKINLLIVLNSSWISAYTKTILNTIQIIDKKLLHFKLLKSDQLLCIDKTCFPGLVTIINQGQLNSLKVVTVTLKAQLTNKTHLYCENYILMHRSYEHL